MEFLEGVIKVLHRVADSSLYVGDIASSLIVFLGGLFAAKKIGAKPPEGPKV